MKRILLLAASAVAVSMLCAQTSQSEPAQPDGQTSCFLQEITYTMSSQRPSP